VGRARQVNWLAVVAHVEWRAERHGVERPIALRWGGELLELVVHDEWVEGPAAAGEPVVRVFIVLDERGRELRIRAGSDGRITVEQAME
jgi:hypothetical protein